MDGVELLQFAVLALSYQMTSQLANIIWVQVLGPGH